MVDVLELARKRRAELTAELKTLEWFLKTAEVLLHQHSEKTCAEQSAPVRPAVVTASQASEEAEQHSPEKPALRVKEPEKGQAAQVYQRPVDTIVFKKMLSEMRRTHQAPNVMPAREKIAASG